MKNRVKFKAYLSYLIYIIIFKESNAAEHLKYNPRNSDLYDDGVSIWKRYMSGSQSSMHGSDMKQNQKANLKESPINDKTK